MHLSKTNMQDHAVTLDTTPTSLLRAWMSRATKIVYQSEANECALACLSMILHKHGNQVSLEELRTTAGNFAQGMTVSDIANAAERNGLVCRPLRLELEELGQLTLPAILHWDMDHYVVLERVHRTSIVLLDPARGRVSVRNDQIGRHFTGIAVELLQGPNLKRRTERKPLSLTALFGPVRGLRSALLNLGMLSLGLELVALASPQAFQIVVDRVLADGDRGLLPVVVVAMVILAITQVVFSLIRSWAIVWISSQISIGWSTGLFSRLLRLPHTFFQNRSLGDISSRFSTLYTMQQAVSTQLVTGVLDGIMSIATGIMLFIYSPKLALFTIFASATYIAVRLAYLSRLKLNTVSALIEEARRQSLLLESIRGSQTLKLFGKTAWQASRYANRSAASIGASALVQRTTAAYSAMGTVTLSTARIGAIAIGAVLVFKGDFTAGMLVAYASYADLFVGRLSSLVEYGTQLSLLSAQAERVADIALAQPEKEPAVPTRLGKEKLQIEFRNVSYRYSDNQPWILYDASLLIPAASTTAICGPSGSGKSTLAKLLLGLAEAQQGDVLFNGRTIREMGPSEVRAQLACVMQDDVLFQGNLGENISFFDEKPNQSMIEEVASLSCIHGDISCMPMGYRTMVGDMGSSLSGGQKQRILLARALYRNPKALLLDEASSHLDQERETSIIRNLRSLKMTVIQIAHRKETLDSADRIFLVQDGKIRSLR
ncbi:peptidase domain-containing ABC transporter [Xanthomonas campestris]|uniref:peptidase domain-containing ABC transporter n=1 Tax=Xanthomonas campestris TaxID=339 RepID=UPI003CF54ECC